MAEHDYVVANDTGANVRADINNALSAIVSQNSKATAPSTTFAYMWWADTTTGILKQRNAGNTDWVSILTLSTGVPIAGTGISNIVEDTTPQLGGDLDLNSNDITGTGGIPSANLTGSVADARIPASAVTQHVSTSNIENDISVLALHQAVQANQTAHGLANSWIEQLEDSTYITNLTNCSRVASDEYVASIYSSGVFSDHSTTTGSGESGSIANLFNNTIADNMSTSGGPTQWFYTDLGSGSGKGCTRYTITSSNLANTGSRSQSWTIAGSNDASSWTDLDSQSGVTWTSNGQTKTYDFTNTTVYRYWRATLTSTNSANAPELGEMEYMTEGTTTSATGSFTSTAVIPQDTTNKSSMGIVVLYKEQSGTTTLNTHLIAKVRANTGQAYQTLTLAAKGTFSTGIKIAIAPAIAVTAGQALSYEISFAGQSSGSLETRVHGVAMTY